MNIDISGVANQRRIADIISGENPPPKTPKREDPSDMPKTAIIALAALIIASTFALAGIVAVFADDGPQLDGHGRRLDCIPASHTNPSGPCLWTPTLTKAEVKVEFEYPHCEIKLDIESNLDELPDGVGFQSYVGYPRITLVHIQPDGEKRVATGPQSYMHHNERDIRTRFPGWKMETLDNRRNIVHFRYKSGETDHLRFLANRISSYFPQTTLGKVYIRADLEYSGNFAKLKSVGGNVKTYGEVSPKIVRTNAIPISHTFAGLFDEMSTCMEIAEREEERAAERVALESQKAGLRQSLTLLKSELTRARQHELDATGILKEVIEVSEKVEEMLRTIQRVRVEGLAERRKIIETYYSEESQRYSVFIQSLESSQAALAAADAAIAARKAELESSRAELERIVSEAQAAEAELIAEIEEAEKALGNDGG